MKIAHLTRVSTVKRKGGEVFMMDEWTDWLCGDFYLFVCPISLKKKERLEREGLFVTAITITFIYKDNCLIIK